MLRKHKYTSNFETTISESILLTGAIVLNPREEEKWGREERNKRGEEDSSPRPARSGQHSGGHYLSGEPKYHRVELEVHVPSVKMQLN